MRLPDTYYTSQMLDGVNKQMSPKQMPALFNQGEDMVITVYLEMNGAPVNTTDNDLFVALKTNGDSKHLKWRGELNNGLFAVAGTPGYFKIWIPPVASMFFQAGAYHLGILAKEKLGVNAGIKDITVTLAEHTIVVRKPTASVYNNVTGAYPELLFDPVYLETLDGELIETISGESFALLDSSPFLTPKAWMFRLSDGGSLIIGAGGSEPYAELESLVMGGSNEVVTGYDVTQGVWEVSLIARETTIPTSLPQ